MIKWLVSALMSPLLKIGEKYLDNEKDRRKLEHGTTRVAVEADASVRKIKLSTWMGRLPMFVAEITCAVYIGSIFVDSTFPSDYLNPLELPEWFKQHFSTIVTSIFGLAIAQRFLNRK